MQWIKMKKKIQEQYKKNSKTDKKSRGASGK
jgi:hypothetical protein